MHDQIFQYIIYPIIGALLLWIGWLIKVQLEDNKKSRELETELHETLNKFIKCQSLLLEGVKQIAEGLNTALKSDDLQFQHFHDSGIMNGESVQHRVEIRNQLNKLDNLIQGFEEMEEELKQDNAS